MILLDTNVVSEVMRKKPSDNVLNWLNLHNHGDLFISSITIAEICYGLRILPIGKRRQLLQIRFNELAARSYAEIMGMCKEKGRPMSLPDGKIAAIAQTNHNPQHN